MGREARDSGGIVGVTLVNIPGPTGFEEFILREFCAKAGKELGILIRKNIK
jgi:hypothetical protein